MSVVETSSPEETVTAGRTLAATLAPGTCIALRGDLGAGKTHFVRGLVEGWGGSDPATSPTFTLVHEYNTPRGPVLHLDLYRARSADEIWAAAHDELEIPQGLVVIEWADRFPELVPPGAIDIVVAHVGAGRRQVSISP